MWIAPSIDYHRVPFVKGKGKEEGKEKEERERRKAKENGEEKREVKAKFGENPKKKKAIAIYQK